MRKKDDGNSICCRTIQTADRSSCRHCFIVAADYQIQNSPGAVSSDLCSGYRSGSRNAGSYIGKYRRKRRRGDFTGNCAPDRTCQKNKKTTLYYVIPLLAGLATGFAFIPPSAGSVLVPLVLILVSTVSAYIPALKPVRPVLEFLGTPFVALIIAVLCAMYFLGTRLGYNGEELKKIMDKSLRPTGQILLVITGGGIIRWVLQDCGMGDIIGPALEKSGLPLIIVAFLIAALIRASVGAAVVAMTMAAGIMAAMPAVANLSPVYLAAMVCAINGGATAFSHVNDYRIHRIDLCNCDQPFCISNCTWLL